MMRFRHWLNELTTTNAMVAYTKDFQADMVRGDWDVSDYNDPDGDKKKKFKPWEAENALYANKHRGDILRWMKASHNNLPEVVTDKSFVRIPDWQALKR
jgi:hypothetical protein